MKSSYPITALAALLILSWLSLSSPALSKVALPPSSCIKCHMNLGAEYAEPVKLLEKSIHLEKEVACHNCHGGDPKSFDEARAMSRAKGFVGRPRFGQIPEFCARCHSDPIRMRPYNLRTDQLAEYKVSQHGKLLYEKGDKNTAVCTSCHGIHDIRSKDDPLSRVYKTNLPKTCARCHSDKKLMDLYKIPSDQFDLFKKSVHGILLLEKSDLRAPGCADCHGIHGAHPPGYAEIANVCSSCHSTIADFFKQSPHYVEKTKQHMARCIDCHGSHDVTYPTTDLYVGTDEHHCGSCHRADSKQVRLALLLKKNIDDAILSVDRARKAIWKIRNSGRNIDKIEETFESAQGELVKARATAHTLDLERVDQFTNKSKEKADEVIKSVKQILDELEGRKKQVIFVVVILGLIIILVSIYYLRVKQQWVERSKK
jgi:hypothetical protein